MTPIITDHIEPEDTIKVEDITEVTSHIKTEVDTDQKDLQNQDHLERNAEDVVCTKDLASRITPSYQLKEWEMTAHTVKSIMEDYECVNNALRPYRIKKNAQ